MAARLALWTLPPKMFSDCVRTNEARPNLHPPGHQPLRSSPKQPIPSKGALPPSHGIGSSLRHKARGRLPWRTSRAGKGKTDHEASNLPSGISPTCLDQRASSPIIGLSGLRLHNETLRSGARSIATHTMDTVGRCGVTGRMSRADPRRINARGGVSDHQVPRNAAFNAFGGLPYAAGIACTLASASMACCSLRAQASARSRNAKRWE
jgi:hypothetical protein